MQYSLIQVVGTACTIRGTRWRRKNAACRHVWRCLQAREALRVGSMSFTQLKRKLHMLKRNLPVQQLRPKHVGVLITK